MTFREALEKEIAAQGLSVAEIARISGVSKGAIYNILNGSTEEDRIRPATRKAIALGCNRDVRVLEGGDVVLVEPGTSPAPVEGGGSGTENAAAEAVRLVLMPGRPFLVDRHVREVFDWLLRCEEVGDVPGLGIVDRVYQRRPEFLSLVLENWGTRVLRSLEFSLDVAFRSGPLLHLPVRFMPWAVAGGRWEGTVFLSAGPPFTLTVTNASCGADDGGFVVPPRPVSYANPGGPSRD